MPMVFGGFADSACPDVEAVRLPIDSGKHGRHCTSLISGQEFRGPRPARVGAAND